MFQLLHVAPHYCLHALWLPWLQACCHLGKHALLCCRQGVACRTMPPPVIKKSCVQCQHAASQLGAAHAAGSKIRSSSKIPLWQVSTSSCRSYTLSSFHCWTRCKFQAALDACCAGHCLKSCAVCQRPSTAFGVPCAHRYLYMHRHRLSPVTPEMVHTSGCSSAPAELQRTRAKAPQHALLRSACTACDHYLCYIMAAAECREAAGGVLLLFCGLNCLGLTCTLACLQHILGSCNWIDAAPHVKPSVLSAVHPGLIDTDLARSWMRNGCPCPLRRVLHPLLDVLFPFILLPPRHAAATLLWAASAPHRTVSLHDAGHDAWRSSGSLTAATSVSASRRRGRAIPPFLLAGCC